MNLTTKQLTPKEIAIRQELKATIAEINAQIEAELRKLSPLLGEEVTTMASPGHFVLALELDVPRREVKVK
jgi:hypothetical protein